MFDSAFMQAFLHKNLQLNVWRGKSFLNRNDNFVGFDYGNESQVYVKGKDLSK